jgi:uncharacterized membrane protein
MGLNDVVEPVGRSLEALGVAIVALTAFVAVVRYVVSQLRGSDSGAAYLAVRRQVGQGVLLGLEVLVAGDIIRTVALDPTLTSVAVLGVVVLVRTFLSVTIDTEINGRWPWSRMSPSADRPDGRLVRGFTSARAEGV